jgi:uncharacterized membrane protein YbaN (DUF454 family)
VKRSTLYAGLGWISAGLGLAGVFIPGLPTTIFVILASYFFARSSPRYEAWLLANRWLGPRLRRYREYGGGMPRSAKIAAVASMWIAISVSCIALVRIHIAGPVVVVAMGVAGTATILYGIRTMPEDVNDL